MHGYFRVSHYAPFAYDEYVHIDLLNYVSDFCSMTDASLNLALYRILDYCLMGFSLKTLASSAFKKLN